MAVTPISGSDNFPVNPNDVYGLVETLAVQNIRAVKSANPIADAFYDYDVENGAVIEEALIEMATRQPFVKTGAPNLSPKDAALHVKYFNNWETGQWEYSVRRNDIRKIIANKGTGVEEVVSEILNALTEGESYYDLTQMASMFDASENGKFDTNTMGFNYAQALGNKVPTNSKGILFALREMYNSIKSPNQGFNTALIMQATPVEDIRIAISEKALNVIDITELANAFNLTKEELFGKIVVLPALDGINYNYAFVYDRKAFGRATRLYEYSQDVIGKGLYTNHYLTTERAYFYNGLFNCVYIDISKAVTNELGNLLEANA